MIQKSEKVWKVILMSIEDEICTLPHWELKKFVENFCPTVTFQDWPTVVPRLAWVYIIQHWLRGAFGLRALFQTALHKLIDGSSVGDIEPRRSDANSVVVERRAIALRHSLAELLKIWVTRKWNSVAPKVGRAAYLQLMTLRVLRRQHESVKRGRRRLLH